MSESQRKDINEDFDFEDDENEDTQEGKYLSFRIASEVYGIEIRHVTEIVGIQKITEVPDMPSYMKGVINLRGNVIPVIDVRLRFHMQPRDYDDRTCVIVVNINESSIGLVVDVVKEVISIIPDQISPAPTVSKGEVARYIKGIARFDGEVIILLAIEELLYDNRLKQVTA
jgi:purine-binding chemotaxis protein CheW